MNRVKRLLARLLSTILLIAAAAWLALPYYTPLILSTLAESHGYRLVALHIERPQRSSLHIASLQLENRTQTLQLSATSITLHYALHKLLTQSVERIQIEQLMIQQQQTQATDPQPAPLQPFTRAIPLQRLEIEQLHYQQGALEIDGTLSATAHEEAINGSVQLSLSPDPLHPGSIWMGNQPLQMESRFNLKQHPTEGITGALKLTATVDDLSEAPIQLSLEGEINGASLSALHATLELPAGELELLDGVLSKQGYRGKLKLHRGDLAQLQQLAMRTPLGEQLTPLKNLSGQITLETEIEGLLEAEPDTLPLKRLQGQLIGVAFEQYGIKVSGLDYPLQLSIDPQPRRFTLHPGPVTIDRIELPAMGEQPSQRIQSLTSILSGALTTGTGGNPLTMALEESRASVLGGTLSIPHAHLPLQEQSPIDIALSGVDLSEIMALLESETLELQGSISGHLPLFYSRGIYTIQHGHLTADAPGAIRFQPLNGESLQALTGDVSRVLSDFRYQTLESSLDFDSASGSARLEAQLLGHNPAFMEGRAVELNLLIEEQLNIRLQ